MAGFLFLKGPVTDKPGQSQMVNYGEYFDDLISNIQGTHTNVSCSVEFMGGVKLVQGLTFGK